MKSVGLPAGSQVTPTGSYMDVNLTLERATPAGVPTGLAPKQAVPSAATARVTGRRVRRGDLPQQRSIEISATQLLLVGVDRSGLARWAAAIPDPSAVRAEMPGPDGLLTGTTLERAESKFRVLLPDHPDIVEARLYQQRATESGLVLDLIGSIPVG